MAHIDRSKDEKFVSLPEVDKLRDAMKGAEILSEPNDPNTKMPKLHIEPLHGLPTHGDDGSKAAKSR